MPSSKALILSGLLAVAPCAAGHVIVRPSRQSSQNLSGRIDVSTSQKASSPQLREATQDIQVERRDTSTVPRPQFGNIPYGVNIPHCNIPGKVALTFDDGPYMYTPELLDTLKANNARATFFVVGSNGDRGLIQDPATGYPDVVRRMINEGHQVGSHSWSHADFNVIGAQERREEIFRLEEALTEILGFFPTYFRPPYTRWLPEAMDDFGRFGYHVTNFDIDTRDWEGNYDYSRTVYSSILSQHSSATTGWIAIAHDIHQQTVQGFVQFMIDEARRNGYDLVPLGECLGDPVTNWYRDPTTGEPFDFINSFSKAKATPPSVKAAAPPAPASPTGADSAASPSETGFKQFGDISLNAGSNGNPAVAGENVSQSSARTSRQRNSVAAFVLGVVALVLVC